MGVNRRDFVLGATASAAALAFTGKHPWLVAPSKEDVLKQIPLQHDQTVRMLREWIAIANERYESCGPRRYPSSGEQSLQRQTVRMARRRGMRDGAALTAVIEGLLGAIAY